MSVTSFWNDHLQVAIRFRFLQSFFVSRDDDQYVTPVRGILLYQMVFNMVAFTVIVILTIMVLDKKL